MDRLTELRAALEAAVREWYEYIRRADQPGGTTTELVCDTERDVYGVTHVGWQDGTRRLRTDVFARIRGGKIWVDEDWTKSGIVPELVRRGIRHEEIVLAFHPPELRHLTDYAAA